MMISIAYKACNDSLSKHFGASEARSLSRILFEDIFDWHTGRRDKEMTDNQYHQLIGIQERLIGGEPLQYITGIADFYGLQFQVTPAVLIPRPETEELVEWVVEHKYINPLSTKILDIGTGSGCIPITIKKNWEAAEVLAWDISSGALAVARTNAEKLGAAVRFEQCDVLQLTDQQITTIASCDIIISNPPYIPRKEATLMPNQVKQHEPDIALFVSNEDPLIFYRTILKLTQKHASQGAYVFFECNEFNAKDVDALGHQMGFEERELVKDMQGKWRMWRGRKA